MPFPKPSCASLPCSFGLQAAPPSTAWLRMAFLESETVEVVRNTIYWCRLSHLVDAVPELKDKRCPYIRVVLDSRQCGRRARVSSACLSPSFLEASGRPVKILERDCAVYLIPPSSFYIVHCLHCEPVCTPHVYSILALFGHPLRPFLVTERLFGGPHARAVAQCGR